MPLLSFHELTVHKERVSLPITSGPTELEADKNYLTPTAEGNPPVLTGEST
jgi:hypothetical protein